MRKEVIHEAPASHALDRKTQWVNHRSPGPDRRTMTTENMG